MDLLSPLQTGRLCRPQIGNRPKFGQIEMKSKAVGALHSNQINLRGDMST